MKLGFRTGGSKAAPGKNPSITVGPSMGNGGRTRAGSALNASSSLDGFQAVGCEMHIRPWQPWSEPSAGGEPSPRPESSFNLGARLLAGYVGANALAISAAAMAGPWGGWKAAAWGAAVGGTAGFLLGFVCDPLNQ